MTRKWGSCSTAGNVTLAADLRIPNHGKLFRTLMTAYVPDWREHDVRKACWQADDES